MSEAIAVPTLAQRLGLKARSRERVRKPGPPRPWRHLLSAICYLTLVVIVAAREVPLSGVIAIALFGILAGLHLRSWARRVPMEESEQLVTLAGIVLQVGMIIF
jgi:hypothetical protein